MKSDTPLDYAVFQLSPKHSRCELYVSSNGNTEKLASGSIKPFVTHLKVAEEQVALAVQSIKLEVEKRKHAEKWFTKGTLERFVRFVSTPEVLELVNTFDAEMSQLESARRIYSQGMGGQPSGALGGDGKGSTAAADATKKELLRAIDVRLVAVRQDLSTACARASAAGFNPDTVSELQLFADQFGGHRLHEASTKFISLWERRSELISPWKPGGDDRLVRASCESDMSIDDPTEDTTGLHLEDLSKPSTCQQPKSVASNFPRQQRNNVTEEDKDGDKTKKVENKDEPQTEPTLATQQPARRLSVQDRIKLFENKQDSPTGSSGGGKPVVAKPAELRRLSSDVSSAPAAVLRRWSGASDMSIDLSADKKDTESPLCTPSSISSVSLSRGNSIVSGVAEGKDRKALNDSVDSSLSGRVGHLGVKDQAEGQIGAGVLGEEEEVGSKVRNNLKTQVSSQTQSKSSIGKTEQVALSDQGVSLEKLNISSASKERSGGSKDQPGSETRSIGFSNRAAVAGGKNQVGSAPSDGGTVNRVEDSRSRDQSMTQLHPRGFQGHTRSFSGQSEGGFGRKPDEASSGQLKGIQPDQLPPQPLWRSFSGELEEEVGRKDLTSSDKQQLKVDSSGTQKMKFQKPASASREQNKRSLGRRDEGGNIKLDFMGDKGSVNQESLATMSTAVEQVQRVRQTKGNQELNDELKLKANELEKLYAEHKLRVPVDQSSFARRSKPVDMKKEEAVSSQHRKPAVEEIPPAQFVDTRVMEPEGSSSNMANFNTPPLKVPSNQDYGDTPKQNFSEVGFSLDSKGKFYERYMQKRDAKLREEWGSKREEKEAKLKAMEDSLEQSRAELNANFSGSADRQDSVSSARRRAEKLRSFNFRSSMKKEQPLDSAPWTPTAPAPRSSAKVSNLSSGRRRLESDNPLVQSVPNFSDLRKENTKPSSGVSKVAANKIAARSQVRSYSRSKSSSEDTVMFKEEKSRRSQSLRKSSANPVEFNTLSPMNSDGVVLVPLRFDKGQTEQGPYDKFPEIVESKSFLRKGNGIGTGSGVSISKLKGFMASETRNNEEEFDELAFEAEDAVDMAKEEEEEEELEMMVVEDDVDMDIGKPRSSQESDKSGNSGSDNVNSVRSLSQADPTSVAELPAAVPSTFHAVESVPGSPGESPMSWNLQMHHPFSYQHETSDIDASVDSPMGSPASWNSHGLSQTDVDAARMRKKWGSAQKPVLATNSSQNQSRKDMTKGFKRLLKFGRKSRGTDNMADWISATTSEGDDDTEDGRDPANRSSDDLRKSRMGFAQGPDDGFNETEFNERVQALSSIPSPPVNFKLREEHISGSSLKAPRSFFSLSSFRSKGSDSKLR
ncbi:hypothetical protein RchiOBHm_Chr2g0146661 [Rosa chinensis]|uniref:COP1-interacting protein 7 n=1 Tax=Rosa chinensis TaxID=74649 RepID=A0A2P6RYX6_ROSCH|nr:uncharacterized protein LOC112186039 isoform X1 [Rosa chinensis]XP_024180159.1 uncharacterized protein LOC112186039 isoform X1 [Rosa chinensis]PRQ51637.1 hypothetical protein RchiOBHm_Chr2g0146661 [Rosa chinensis]